MTLRPFIVLACSALLALAVDADAAGIGAPVRQQVLDAVRPQAAAMAGQPLRIRVRLLNVDRGWALLIGDVRTPAGAEPDWGLSESCDNGLDKALFALAHRVAGAWQVTHLDLCEGDPPWEEPASYDGLDLPCGIYRGVPSIYEDKPLAQCLRHQSATRRR